MNATMPDKRCDVCKQGMRAWLSWAFRYGPCHVCSTRHEEDVPYSDYPGEHGKERPWGKRIGE